MIEKIVEVMEIPLRILRLVHIANYIDYRLMIRAKSITDQRDFEEDFDDMSRMEMFNKQLFESYYHLS